MHRIAVVLGTFLLALAFVAPGSLAQESENADIPSFAATGLTKEEFLQRRSEAIGRRRGILPGVPFDPHARTAAILLMEQQELLRDGPLRSGAAAWTELGPAPIPNGQTSPTAPVSGRTISIAVDPADPDIAYVGTAQGGLYRTTNGGGTWTPLMDGAMSLAIGAVAVAPSQTSTVYVGTGEPNFSGDSFFGVGVYRIDNAASASPTLSGPFNQDGGASDVFTGRSVSEILVHPTDPATIFVSTTFGLGGIQPAFLSPLPIRGIYRSTNATSGSPTFTRIGPLPAPNDDFSIRDIAFDPLDPNIMVASLVANGGGIYRSTNALAGSPTFTNVLTFTGGTSTTLAELAVHNTAGPNATFFAATGFGGGRVYRSTDGGATWSLRVTNGFCGGQCFYDIAIAVDPGNADRVYLGGDPTLIFGFSTNGGTSFTPSESGLHVDTHALAVSASDPTVVYLGTDGGIYRSTNSGTSWVNLNNSTFMATQFMGIDVHPTDANFSIGGTQDNGTNFYQPAGTWTRADFGDGGWAVIDQNAPDVSNVRMYHTYFNVTSLQGYGTVASVASAMDFGWAFRGCQVASSTVNGITCTGAVNFYAPLVRGPGTPNTIYYGSDRLYRSTDEGLNHTVVSQNPIVPNVPINTIGISPQDDDVRIVGLSNGAIYGTSTGSSSLSNLDVGNAVPSVEIGRAVVDPTSSTTAYVTLSAFNQVNVWKTTNLSNVNPTWTAAAGAGGTAIPQVPVNSFVVDPLAPDQIYAGTDIGVYYSSDGGTTWNPFGTGLPRVAVFGMAIAPNRMLRIATHGRGFWEIAAAAPPGTDAPTVAVEASGEMLISPSVLSLPGQVRIQFAAVPGESSPVVHIRDVTGRLVAQPASVTGTSGRRVAHWDGRDREGSLVSSGVYFVTVSQDRGRSTGRIVIRR